MTFTRRIGPDPHAGGRKTECLDGCPDIWELENGDFAVIGKVITQEALPHLPSTAGCGKDEAIVWLPRRTLVEAKQDIPNS